MNKRILITGADGFIGNALFKSIKDENSAYGWGLNQLSNENYTAIDMLDKDEVMRRLQLDMPDVIIHCAGCADVNKSVTNPDWDYNGNVTIFHNLLFGLHQNNMHNTRVVFLSSAAVYGNPEVLPIKEDAALHPLSPYALHKVMCEQIADYFRENYAMDIRVARIFSAYGRGLKKQLFWDMHNKLKDTGELRLFGTGLESRDYIHINDLVNALLLIATTDETSERVFNVANGTEVTIREAAELFAKAKQVSNNLINFSGEKREGNPNNWCANNSRLCALGYKQTICLSDGLKDYCEWLREG